MVNKKQKQKGDKNGIAGFDWGYLSEVPVNQYEKEHEVGERDSLEDIGIPSKKRVSCRALPDVQFVIYQDLMSKDGMRRLNCRSCQGTRVLFVSSVVVN